MGKEPEQIFSQRRHIHGQQINKKVLKITNQKNSNKNYNEVSPHTGLGGYYQKTRGTFWRGYREKETLGKCKLVQPL